MMVYALSISCSRAWTGTVALLLAAGGCHALLEIDDIDFGDPSSGGSAGIGGSSTVTGSGTGTGTATGSAGSGGASATGAPGGAGTAGGGAAGDCSDDTLNGLETDVDCGGPVCPACANGSTCQVGSDCTSGSCPADDFVCCDLPCTGTCEACLASKTGSATGTCGLVSSGQDPDGECAPMACVAGACSDHTLVFVSSEIYDSNLGGLAGADANCQALASAAGLAGTFLAWLSDSAESPGTRFSRPGLAYRLVDGTQLATDWADLTDGTVAAEIALDELGNPAPATNVPCSGTAEVWTGTYEDGTPFGTSTNRCSDWTATSGSGCIGKYDFPSSWSYA